MERLILMADRRVNGLVLRMAFSVFEAALWLSVLAWGVAQVVQS